MKENKNLPNFLTTLRMILTPVLILCMLASEIPYLGIVFSTLAFLLFIGIAITDYFDGKIARDSGNITDFGKLFDPIADKIFVFSVLIMFVGQEKVSAIITCLLLAREVIVLGVKQILLEKEGNVVAASNLAKYKTITQMIALGIIFLIPRLSILGFEYIVKTVTTILLLPALVLSYISMFEYIKRAEGYIKDDIDAMKTQMQGKDDGTQEN